MFTHSHRPPHPHMHTYNPPKAYPSLSVRPTDLQGHFRLVANPRPLAPRLGRARVEGGVVADGHGRQLPLGGRVLFVGVFGWWGDAGGGFGMGVERAARERLLIHPFVFGHCLGIVDRRRGEGGLEREDKRKKSADSIHSFMPPCLPLSLTSPTAASVGAGLLPLLLLRAAGTTAVLPSTRARPIAGGVVVVVVVVVVVCDGHGIEKAVTYLMWCSV